MSDPFLPHNSEKQLIREAKFGFLILALVFSVVSYWGFYQYKKFENQVPLHVKNAPVAKHVGPDDYLGHLTREEPQRNHDPVVLRAAAAKIDDLPNSNFVDSPRLARRTPLAHTAAHVEPNRIKNPAKVASYEQPVETPANNYEPPDLEAEKKRSESRLDNSPLTKFSDNVVKITDIAKSFVSPGETLPATDDAHQVPCVVESLNPVTPPTTQDKSRSLTPFQQHDTAPDQNDNETVSPATVESHNEFVPLNPTISTPVLDSVRNSIRINSNQLPSETNDQDDALDFQAHQKVGKQYDDGTIPTSIDDSESLPSDETILLEVIDPQKSKRAVDQTEDTRLASHVYQTRRGDSFWSIASLKYGDGRFFRALYEHNRTSVEGFENLPLNTEIRTPAAEFLQSRYPVLCPPDLLTAENSAQSYRTVDGDTLFEIARQITGQASRYLELLQINQDRLPIGANHLTRLPADIELRLPTN